MLVCRLKGTILETASLAPDGDPRECMNLCSSNPDCYAYNYLKVDKLCVLLSTEYDSKNLEMTFKWSSGYKWGCHRATSPPPPNFAVTVQSTTLSGTVMTITISGISYYATQYQAVCIPSGGLCPTDSTSGVRSPAFAAPVPYEAIFTSTLTVTGLQTNTLYTCYAQAQDTSPLPVIEYCSAGVTVST